jgi:hypothetical protein
MVEGGGPGTSISTGGLLRVDENESASSLTVRATSTVDTGKSGTAAVRVIKKEQGKVTLVYPEEAEDDPFQDTIVLSKSNPDEQTLEVNGEYDTYRWRVDGSVKGNGKTLVLNAASYSTGTHRISVEVTLKGVVYSKSGTFTVED